MGCIYEYIKERKGEKEGECKWEDLTGKKCEYPKMEKEEVISKMGKKASRFTRWCAICQIEHGRTEDATNLRYSQLLRRLKDKAMKKKKEEVKKERRKEQ